MVINEANVMKNAAVKFMLGLSLAAGAASSQGQSNDAYSWYDNGRQRHLVPDEKVVVEFGHRREAASQPRYEVNGVRMWDKADPAAARARAAGTTSPLLRDAATGAERALPGNVIVRLNPDWTAAQVAAWLHANDLREVARLPVGNNVLVVSSPPGLPSLELANRLQQSGTVVSAQPNWWQKMHAR